MAGIFGIGVDIESNERIENMIKKWGDHFLERVFTKNEIAYCRLKRNASPSYTARFAAKEALLKAMGTGLRDGYRWKDIEILNDPLGKPSFKLHGKVQITLKNNVCFLSISHTHLCAVAYVLIEN
jgi:holo-[acyl-carrier protein] synthase